MSFVGQRRQHARVREDLKPLRALLRDLTDPHRVALPGMKNVESKRVSNHRLGRRPAVTSTEWSAFAFRPLIFPDEDAIPALSLAMVPQVLGKRNRSRTTRLVERSGRHPVSHHQTPVMASLLLFVLRRLGVQGVPSSDATVTAADSLKWFINVRRTHFENDTVIRRTLARFLLESGLVALWALKSKNVQLVGSCSMSSLRIMKAKHYLLCLFYFHCGRHRISYKHLFQRLTSTTFMRCFSLVRASCTRMPQRSRCSECTALTRSSPTVGYGRCIGLPACLAPQSVKLGAHWAPCHGRRHCKLQTAIRSPRTKILSAVFMLHFRILSTVPHTVRTGQCTKSFLLSWQYATMTLVLRQ